MDISKLKAMVAPYMEGKAYFRPFVCSGDLSKVNIFLVGINPATPITPKDLDVDTYVDLLLNYDKFISFYKKSRKDRFKSEISRTRLGMSSFVDWLCQYTHSSVLETDVIAYPTASLKELKREPEQIRNYGKEIFLDLLLEFRPSLVILHGKKTVQYTMEVFTEHKVKLLDTIDLDSTIEDMESKHILTKIDYGDKTGIIMACRHFMYYGKDGETFKTFKGNVLSNLRSIKFE